MGYEHRSSDIEAGVQELVETVSDFLRQAGLNGFGNTQGVFDPELSRDDIPEFVMTTPERELHFVDDPEEVLPGGSRDQLAWEEVGEKLLDIRAIESSSESGMEDYVRFLDEMEKLPTGFQPNYISKNHPFEVYVISALMNQRGETVEKIFESAGQEYEKWNQKYSELMQPVADMDSRLFEGEHRSSRYVHLIDLVRRGEQDALKELEDHLYRAAMVRDDVYAVEIEQMMDYLERNIDDIRRYHDNTVRVAELFEGALDFEIDKRVKFPHTDVYKEVEKEVVNQYFRGTLGERDERENFLGYIENEYGEAPKKYAENLWWEYTASDGEEFERLKSALTLGKRMEFEL